MKTAEYSLPFGVHPLLEPQITGRTEPKKDKNGAVILSQKDGLPGEPIYTYTNVTTPEAENLSEFINSGVFVDPEKAEELTLREAQGQNDIKRQRVMREYAASQEVSDLLDGKTDETKGLSDAERRAYALKEIQAAGDGWRLGIRSVTGGQNAAAKKALDNEKKLAQAVAADPALAKAKAKLDAMLAETLAKLGVAQ